MEITLNHTIIPTHNHIDSAKFYERVFGFEFVKEWGNFAVVRVNSSLTLDFMNKAEFHSLHFAFKVSESEFDQIFNNIKNEGIAYGSSPSAQEDGKINYNNAGRGMYFKDMNGHVLEILTQDYNLDI
ncbi:MAG: VOC family protein [Methylophilaceae bacterium]